MPTEIEYLLIEIESIIKILDSYLQHNDRQVEIGCLFFLSDNLTKRMNEITGLLLNQPQNTK